MTRPETSSEIDDAAAAWAAKVDRGLTAEEERALDAWLAGDVRRAGAFAKARAMALYTERARALGEQNAHSSVPASVLDQDDGGARPRRRVVFGSAIAAAVACVMALAAFLLTPHAQVYATRVGQVTVAPLEDGSVVTLNTASEIAVKYSEAERAIELVAGEVLFDVAKNRARPFVVAAGDTRVRAIGTSFTVRRLRGRPVEVLVREGIVEVTVDGVAKRITANVRAVADARTVAIAAIAPEKVGRELAWRDGRLAFEGETLGQAAAEFARYSDTRIVIRDPAVARRTVAGLYVSTDPVGFARAVAVAMDLQVTVAEGEVRLSPQ